jgi:nudix-type nucleoside diphosphatase (YffH/AdpP family)
MTVLFFFGTLRDRELLEIVLDRPVAAGELRPARAPGFAARRLHGQAYPHLVAEPGAAAEGVLFTARADEHARIDYFEEAEYGLTPIRVETDAGPADACYYRSTEKLSPGEGLWDYAAWQGEARAVALEAARELMAHYGVVPVEDIDRIWPGIMTRARMRARARAALPAAGRLRRAREPGDVEALGLERPYTGFFALEEHRLRHRLFDGGWSEEVSRTIVSIGDAVTVVPYDPRRDRVLLIEQFRAAMFARGDRCPWGVEAVAGRIDAEMEAETAARREAREEAGVELGRIEKIAAYYTTPGYAAEQVTSLIGEADLADAGGRFGVAHEHEDIRAFTVPLDEALAGVARGEIDNAPAILSLLWLAQNRERLRAAWAEPAVAGVEAGAGGG